MTRKKLLETPNQDRRQENTVQEFSGAMLHRLRAQDQWFHWKPEGQEMILALSKAWANIEQATKRGDKRAAAEYSADLGNLAMKCFNHYGKQNS